MESWRFDAIGTRWEIETDAPLPDALRADVDTLIERFDREWSRFRLDSDVQRLGREGGVLRSPDAGAMLDAYRELSAATGGAVNPLVADSLSALGYDAGYSLTAGAPAAAPAEWTQELEWTADAVTASAPMMLDVGALGKGRLVDLVSGVLAGHGAALVVDAGGDMRTRGTRTRVALEHPYDPAKAIGVVELTDAALCASAVNRRVWGDGLHHVLDARTGIPVRTWAATWAIAPEAMPADAAATALFFDGGPDLASAWGVEWVRMATDGRVERSDGFPGTLFTGKGSRR